MQPNERAFMERCKVDPVFFCEKVLGVELWSKQKQILESVRDNPNTICVSCNAGGKSFVSACATLWWLYTHKDSLVLTTAPTYRQVISVLWGEIGRLWNNARIPLGGEMTQGKIQISDKWMALGLPSSEEVRFQGFHAEDILIIFDEASGVDPCIFTAASGNLTSQNSRWLLIGNPTSPSGKFFENSTNPNWKRINISAFDSPAIQEPDKYPYLVNMKWINERKAEWGEKSPMYISRVLGQFPTESEDTLIPMSWVDRAVRRWLEDDRKSILISEHIYFGLDVARKGMDKTVLVEYQPNKVIGIHKHQGKDTVETQKLAVRQAIQAGGKLLQITVDDTSVGGGVVDNLRAQGYPAIGINYSQKATNPRHFKRIRDELLWGVRQAFQKDEIAIPPDEALINQLTSIKYSQDPVTHVIMVEGKDDMLGRGMKSPDEVDALSLAIFGARRLKTGTTRAVSSSYTRDRYEDKAWY